MANEWGMNDVYGRTIIDVKCQLSYNGYDVIFRGAQRKINYDKSEFVESFQPNQVPEGFYHRKGYEYFYKPILKNILNILYYKVHHPYTGITLPFALVADAKIKEFTKGREALSVVENLSLKDVDKIKALKDNGPKFVDDFLHQKIASQWAFHLPSCALLEEQGLGKTKTAIETFMAKRDAGLIDRCLVIAPLSVLGKMAWLKQIKEYTDNTCSAILVRGSKEEKIAILNGEHGEYEFYLINYEGLLNIEYEITEWVDGRTMVIGDETTKVKNWAAKRTKAFVAVGQRADHKLILNGTPVTQGAYDVFSQFMFLDGGDTFGTSYEKFLDEYFYQEGYKRVPRGKKSLQEISDLMFKKAVRFTKDEALDLPPKTYQVRQVLMQPVQAEYYLKILREEIIRLSELEEVTAQNILVTILRLQQITSGFVGANDIDGNSLGYKLISGPNPKLQELEDLLEELGDKPVVIWSRFRHDVDSICKLLERLEITHVKFIGGMSEQDRNNAESKFMNGQAQIFVSIPAAGGLGMNLQRASYAIYFNNDYSLQNRLQSEDRIHRIGQTNNVTIIDLCAVHPNENVMSIDYLVHEVLKGKKNVADIVTGDWKATLSAGLGL